MAYVYSNALNVSIALIVFGLIQVGMFVSCLFGCFAHFPADFASPAWSGGLSVFAGLFGICMICSYKEIKWGKMFFFLSIVAMVTSLACLAITAGHTMVREYALADESADRAGDGTFVATGLAINGAVLVFGLVLLVCACYATWLNCCCDDRPSKGYVMTLDTVENTHYVNVEAQPPAQ